MRSKRGRPRTYWSRSHSALSMQSMSMPTWNSISLMDEHLSETLRRGMNRRDDADGRVCLVDEVAIADAGSQLLQVVLVVRVELHHQLGGEQL